MKNFISYLNFITKSNLLINQRKVLILFYFKLLICITLLHINCISQTKIKFSKNHFYFFIVNPSTHHGLFLIEHNSGTVNQIISFGVRNTTFPYIIKAGMRYYRREEMSVISMNYLIQDILLLEEGIQIMFL